MTRERRYPVPGEPVARTADKPAPTKEQVLLVMDSDRGVLLTRPQVLMSCARLFALPESPTPTESWARHVMDYPATERLFDRMVRDDLIVGKVAHEWKRMSGLTSRSLQTGATYYVTARRALAIQQKGEKHDDEQLWAQSQQAAMEALATLHPDQFERLTREIYEKLREQTP